MLLVLKLIFLLAVAVGLWKVANALFFVVVAEVVQVVLVHHLTFFDAESAFLFFFRVAVVFFDAVKDTIHLLLQEFLKALNHLLVDGAALDEIGDQAVNSVALINDDSLQSEVGDVDVNVQLWLAVIVDHVVILDGRLLDGDLRLVFKSLLVVDRVVVLDWFVIHLLNSIRLTLVQLSRLDVLDAQIDLVRWADLSALCLLQVLGTECTEEGVRLLAALCWV